MPNQHSDGVAVNLPSTSARLAAVRGGNDPVEGGASQTPGCTACCSNSQSPVMATHSIAAWAMRPFAAATSDHATSILSPQPAPRDAGWSTRAYASNVTGSSDPTSYSK